MKTFKDMEPAFYREVRKELLSGLAQTTKGQQRIFLYMYAGQGDSPTKTIEETVRDIPRDKLDWAMQQVQRTLDKRVAEQQAQ